MRSARIVSSVVALVVIAGSLLGAATPPSSPAALFGPASVVVDCSSLQGDWFTKAAVSTTLQNLTPGAAYTLKVAGGDYTATFPTTADANGAATVDEAATAGFAASGGYYETLSLAGQEVDHLWVTASACTPDAPTASLSLTLSCPSRFAAAGTVYGRATRLTGTLSGLRPGVDYQLSTSSPAVYYVTVTADSSGAARIDKTTDWPLVPSGLVEQWAVNTQSQGVVLASGSLTLAMNCPALTPAPRTKVTHDYDISGDGFADLLSIDTAGHLRYYANNSHSNPGHVPFVSNIIVGSGWRDLRFPSAGDVNGDGLADIVGSDQQGILKLYTNSIKTSPKAPFAKVTTIGSGWNSIVDFFLGDVTGDGYADIIAYHQDGSRWLYQNRYKTDPLHRPFSSAVRIGATGVFSFKAAAGDINGDGYADMVDAPDTHTAIFPNLTPAGNLSDPFAALAGVGNAPSTDWPAAGYALGDWEGRGYDSLIAANPGGTGNLVYVKDPIPLDGGPSTATVISTGWQVIDEIIP